MSFFFLYFAFTLYTYVKLLLILEIKQKNLKKSVYDYTYEKNRQKN